MEHKTIEITWSSLWKIFFMLVLTVALFLAREILLLVFLAIVISSALDAPVTFFQNRKIPRIFGTLFLFLAIFGVLAAVLYVIIPVSIIELKGFMESLRGLKIPVIGSLDAPHLAQKLNKGFDGLTDVLFSGGVSVIDAAASIFGNIIMTIAVFVLSFYLTIDRSGVEKFLRAILPINQEEEVIDIYYRVRKRLGLWLRGQFVLMIAIGLSFFLGLWFLGVKYSLILGLLAGILEIVPIAGPVFAGALAFLAAVSQSFALGLYTLIFFFIIQQIESHFLVPFVMKKTVGINPVIVVIAILAGSQIAGFVGVILAVPTAVIFQEMLADWEKQKMKYRRLPQDENR